MTKLEVGDKFIPRKPKDTKERSCWVEEMDEYDGKVLTVSFVNSLNNICTNETSFTFSPDWCEKVEEVDEEPFIIATTNHEMGITYEELPIRGAITEARACGISGIPNEQEHTPETSKTIDWEQRRYEIAKDFMTAQINGLYLKNKGWSYDYEARYAVDAADVLITQLQKSLEK